MAPVREEQMVFCLAPQEGGTTLVLLGIPAKAWEFMKDGKTHTFDFTNVGVPVRIMLYGGKDHRQCMEFIERAAKNKGVTLVDQRCKDFGIKGRAL